MERQQRFLSAMREQAMGWDLPLKLPRLITRPLQEHHHRSGGQRHPQAGLLGHKARRRAHPAGQPHRRHRHHRRHLVRARRRRGHRRRGARLPHRPGQRRRGHRRGDRHHRRSSGSSSTSTSVADRRSERGRRGRAQRERTRGGGGGRRGVAAQPGGDRHTRWATPRRTLRSPARCKYPSGMSAKAKLVAKAVGAESVSRSSSVERVTVSLGR